MIRRLTERRFLKGLSFEVASNIVGFGVAYLMFGNLSGCVTYTAVCFGLRTGLFVAHEKVWEG